MLLFLQLMLRQGSCLVNIWSFGLPTKLDLVNMNIHSNFNRYILFLPILLSLIQVCLILLFPKFLPPKLPLFYSIPWGENQLATTYQMLIIPGSLASIALLNLLLSWQLHSSQTLFQNILKATSFICTIVLLITFIKIVLIFI